MSKAITGRDFTILVPTKDRPDKLKDLLESIANQEEACGRVIVVASGMSVEDVVMGFADRLDVEYHFSATSGQIKQRNLGIALLDEKTPLVCFIDDDIVVEPNALKKMVEFWNRSESDTAGVAFNIVDETPWFGSWWRRFFILGGEQCGQISKSGFNPPIWSIKEDIQTAWLPGGATAWRTDIVKKYPHHEVHAKWAPCEDLIFSYPIGKTYRLYVCAASHVRHARIQNPQKRMPNRYYGRQEMMWRLYFVTLYDEFRVGWLIWSSFGLIANGMIQGIIAFDVARLELMLGRIEGLFQGLKALVEKKDLRAEIEAWDMR